MRIFSTLLLLLFTFVMKAQDIQPRQQQIVDNLNMLRNYAEPDTTKYIHLAHETISLAEEVGRPEDVARAYGMLVTYFVAQGNAERGGVELSKMRRFYEKTGKGGDEFFTAWQNYVVQVFNEGNPLKAMTEYHEMHMLATQKKNDYGLAKAYTALGAISEYSYELGIDGFNQALKLLRATGHEDEEFYIYYQMADLSYNNEKFDETLRYLDLMLALDNAPFNLKYYGNYLKLFVYDEKGWYEEEKAVYEEIKQYWDNGDLGPGFLRPNALALCLYVSKYGNPDDMLKYLDYIDIPTERLQMEVRYYKAKGNFKKALEVTESYDSIEHKKMMEIQRANVSNATAFYRNKELVAKNLALEMANSKSNLLLISILFVVFVVVTLYIIYSVRRHNKFLQKERENTEAQSRIADEQRKIAEKERAKALLVNEMKAAFIQNLSHEVRTPLNSIVGFNELLNSPDYSFWADERTEMVEAIKSQTNVLTTLLNNVIYLSRIDGNDVRASKSEVRLCEVIDTVVETTKKKLAPGVEIVVEFDETADSDFVLDTDRSLLSVALNNVFDNTAKFTKEGRITLSVAMHEDIHGDNMLSLTVSDTGVGIPPSAADRIFDRFEKLGSMDTGFGLGLCITQESLALIGGNIRLDSSYTDGARFVIELKC